MVIPVTPARVKDVADPATAIVRDPTADRRAATNVDLRMVAPVANRVKTHKQHASRKRRRIRHNGKHQRWQHLQPSVPSAKRKLP